MRNGEWHGNFGDAGVRLDNLSVNTAIQLCVDVLPITLLWLCLSPAKDREGRALSSSQV